MTDFRIFSFVDMTESIDSTVTDDTEPLLNEANGDVGPRQRWKPSPVNLPKDWDPNLPYGGKVYLARKKKKDPRWVLVIEVILVFLVVCFAFYSYYYFEHLHFRVTHAYAHMGFPHAQHQVAHRYLAGQGTDKHEEHAMHWFRKASDQGHADAAYNLAVGHLKGIKTDVKPGEAHHLIAHAANNGVRDAHRVLNEICVKGGCE